MDISNIWTEIRNLNGHTLKTFDRNNPFRGLVPLQKTPLLSCQNPRVSQGPFPVKEWKMHTAT